MCSKAPYEFAVAAKRLNQAALSLRGSGQRLGSADVLFEIVEELGWGGQVYYNEAGKLEHNLTDLQLFCLSMSTVVVGEMGAVKKPLRVEPVEDGE